MGGMSLGLLAGGQAAEVMLLINSQKVLDSMLSTKVKLGAGASIAVAPRVPAQVLPPTSSPTPGPRAHLSAWLSKAR